MAVYGRTPAGSPVWTCDSRPARPPSCQFRSHYTSDWGTPSTRSVKIMTKHKFCNQGRVFLWTSNFSTSLPPHTNYFCLISGSTIIRHPARKGLPRPPLSSPVQGELADLRPGSVNRLPVWSRVSRVARCTHYTHHEMVLRSLPLTSNTFLKLLWDKKLKKRITGFLGFDEFNF